MAEFNAEPTSAAVAAYIEDMLGDLASMAAKHGLRTLAPGLSMLALEAARLAEAPPKPADR